MVCQINHTIFIETTLLNNNNINTTTREREMERERERERERGRWQKEGWLVSKRQRKIERETESDVENCYEAERNKNTKK